MIKFIATDMDGTLLNSNNEIHADFYPMFQSLKEKDININTISKSKSLPIDLGENTKIEVYSPSDNKYENLNNYSPILKIYYGETSFLFTGDAENEAEMEAVKSNKNLKSDVLKVGHHEVKLLQQIHF
mgnify:CR=1 FL=1